MQYTLLRILPFLLPLLLTAFIVTYRFTYNTIENQQYETIKTELSYASETIDDRINTIDEWMSALARNGLIINALVDDVFADEYIPQLFKTLKPPGPQEHGMVFMLDYDGEIIAKNTSREFSFPNKLLERILNKEPNTVIGVNGLVKSAPILINGLPEAYLVVFLPPEQLSKLFLIQSIHHDIIAINVDGYIVAAPEHLKPQNLGLSYKDSKLHTQSLRAKKLRQNAGITLVSLIGNDVTFKAVDDVKIALIGFIVIALSGIFIALWISTRITSHEISKMIFYMNRLRNNPDATQEVNTAHISEFSHMQNAYNKMAKTLQKTTVSKDYIGSIFNALPLPVCIVDNQGLILQTNNEYIGGFSSEEGLEPTHFQDMIHIDDRHIRPFDLLGHTEQEIRLYKNAKRTRPYIISSSPLHDKNMQIDGFIITATDIQDRKDKEKEIIELAEQNKLMARAIEQIDLGVTIADATKPQNPLIFCNQAFLQLSGQRMRDVIGRNCSFMQGVDTDPKAISQIRSAIKGQQSITTEIINYTKQGDRFWNELSLNPIMSHNGELKYYVGIQKNITGRKQIEEIKREFISTVSHELRTPLTSIHGSLGLIRDLYMDNKDSDEQELIKVAYRNAERLKVLVDDILDTEKLDAGEMTFRFEISDLSDVIYQGVELNIPYGDKYNVQFKVDQNLPSCQINVDSDRMIQVFANILSNAAKFSGESDHVDISAELLEDTDHVRIIIRDHGAGIPEAFRGRIFSKFAQHDSSDTRSLPGTGLGLYITRKIVESHNATISFETQEGIGTSFFIDIPTA